MRYGLLFLFLIRSSVLFAQESWDASVLDTCKIFKGIYEASQNPDSVYRLDLSKKKLKEFPAEVLQFKQLRELNISRNNIEQLPELICSLPNLQRLYINNNKLTALPTCIGNLKNLQILELNRNLIESLPVEIGLLINLEELSLWDNELGDIPEEIKNIGTLKKVELRGILFNSEQQKRVHDLLPYTTIYFSPSCNCKN